MTGVHFLDAAAPDGVRIYAIGDVHGRLDLLQRMHEQIAAEVARDRPARRVIIHLGDYVDRGPNSAGVLDFLIEATGSDSDIIALAGNHDLGLPEFVRTHAIMGSFARYGGGDTARSYGIEADFADEDAARKTAKALRAIIPHAHLRFIDALPLTATFGDFFFCHAGIRPGIALDKQDPRDLVWIRDEFLGSPHLHPKVVVHGHTPSSEPEVMPNRVNVDTRAYESGVLTALVVDGKEKRFIRAAC